MCSAKVKDSCDIKIFVDLYGTWVGTTICRRKTKVWGAGSMLDGKVRYARDYNAILIVNFIINYCNTSKDYKIWQCNSFS